MNVKPTTIDRADLDDGITVSMVRLPCGRFEVMALDRAGDEAAPQLRTAEEGMARDHFRSLRAMFQGGEKLGRFWAGSASASFERAVRAGNVRTVLA